MRKTKNKNKEIEKEKENEIIKKEELEKSNNQKIKRLLLKDVENINEKSKNDKEFYEILYSLESLEEIEKLLKIRLLNDKSISVRKILAISRKNLKEVIENKKDIGTGTGLNRSFKYKILNNLKATSLEENVVHNIQISEIIKDYSKSKKTNVDNISILTQNNEGNMLLNKESSELYCEVISILENNKTIKKYYCLEISENPSFLKYLSEIIFQINEKRLKSKRYFESVCEV